MMTGTTMLAAVLLDWLLGEPKKWHPLLGFGCLAQSTERLGYGGRVTPLGQRCRGIGAVALLLIPITGLAAALAALDFGVLFNIAALYVAIGHKSLHEHARAVLAALAEGNELEARRRAALMVSRDPETLDIERATVESVLENGNDAIFGALFWFAVAGAPGAVCYRLANTLDAMWGYRNARYRDFGWAAARLDDVLNLIPARLTALTYALLGRTRLALACWHAQAPHWESPNAGPVMASGAGALGLSLGGTARYDGHWHERPTLGDGHTPCADDIGRALALVRRGVWFWLVVTLALGLAAGLVHV